MKISQHIVGTNKNIEKKAFIWNIIASTLNAGMSAILLIAVTRTVGVAEAGIFSLAFSIAQLMLTIGYFDMRAYQVTDVKQEVQFRHYLASRVITCAIMMVVSIGYIWIKEYDRYKSTIILLLCILKMLDALEDVLHGLFQQRERLDVAGKLQSVRLIFTMAVFVTILTVSRNLSLACIGAILTSVLIIICFNFPIVPLFEKTEVEFDYVQLKKLFAACFPLFLGSYLALYMGNAPKYAIDEFLSPEYQTYYNILFMPSFVVNLFSGFAFRPLLTPLAKSWMDGDKKKYCSILKKLVLWVGALTVSALAGAYVLGIPILSFVYNTPLNDFKGVLLILILGGGISATGTILYYSLTVMRNQKLLLIGYAITAAAAFFLSPVMVKHFGITGAALAYLMLIALRIICFFITFLISYYKK